MADLMYKFYGILVTVILFAGVVGLIIALWTADWRPLMATGLAALTWTALTNVR